jgi:hypothetical protein
MKNICSPSPSMNALLAIVSHREAGSPDNLMRCKDERKGGGIWCNFLGVVEDPKVTEIV